MPGINLIKDKFLYKKKEEIRKSLDSINYLGNFESEEIINNDFLSISSNKYKEYPISNFCFKNYSVLMEGKIYNKSESELKSDINTLINDLPKNNFESILKEWMLSADGDYIIFMVDQEKNDILIFNDIFGRLPLYYHQTESGVIVSRYLKFITGLIQKYEIDKIALAEFLLLGYMLGHRTLFKNLNHLRPATALYIKNFQVESRTVFQFNFDNRKYSNYPFEKNVDTLANLFTEASISRLSNTKKNIVTLSGGLDSRLVGSCMFRNKIPFEAATLVTERKNDEEEAEIARKLTAIYNVGFNIFKLSRASGKNLYELLRLKEGMNSLANSRLLNFYSEIARHYGNDINLITGDNGDKLIFTFDRPLKSFNSLEELAGYIIDEHSLMKIDVVSSALKTSINEIKEDLIGVLKIFPETNLSQSYIHFRVIEKPFKYAFQGEDRHRNYFWHLTPFWSIPFFDYIMNVPDTSKVMHKLFGRLIEIFSPDSVKLTYTNFRSPIVSLKGKMFMNLVYYGYPLVPKKLKGVLKNEFFPGNPIIIDEPNLIQSIIQVHKDSAKAADVFDFDEKILKSIRKIPLFNILTLTSAIQYFYEKDSSLKKYFPEEF